MEVTVPYRERRASSLGVHIDDTPPPASGIGRIQKIVGDRRACDKMAPCPAGDVLPARAARLVALGILYGRCVDERRLASARP